MRRLTMAVAFLVGLAGSSCTLYGAMFWLPYHLQGARLHFTGMILVMYFLLLLLVSWAAFAARRLWPEASGQRLLGYDLAFAAATAVLAVPVLLSPIRLVFVIPLAFYLILVCVDLVGCLARQPA